MDLKDKKVLLMGLGILGGGVATARFLALKGAKVTVTDMKTKEFLKPSLEKLSDFGDKIEYILSEHREKDFLETDLLVINPDVPADNKFVDIARKAGKQIENELTIFYKFMLCEKTVAITGTRGKTTVTNWIGYILKNAGKDARVLGNDPDKPFLSEINYCTEDTIAVIETPSFQLEIFGDSGKAPNVAVITNLYQDHLSRHKTMEAYALAKANIFKNQTKKDFLILDQKNQWTEFFLGQKPKAKVVFSNEINLVGFDTKKFLEEYGAHNLQNFFAAASSVKALGVSDEEILKASKTLPQIKWRQELVYKSPQLKIYNDTAATSPEATISAIQRFKKVYPNDEVERNKEHFVLIAGGTDRELDFKEWGKFVNENLKPENLILLSGSATEKMKKELSFIPAEFGTLEECLKEALDRVEKHSQNTKNPSTIVFSPGAKSFEKFKNEFDRGAKFNALLPMSDIGGI